MTKKEKLHKVIDDLLEDREVSSFRIYKYDDKEGENYTIIYEKIVKHELRDDEDTDNPIVPEEHLD